MTRSYRALAVVGALWLVGGAVLIFLAGALCTVTDRERR